jgi:hypothetical protein
MKTNVTIDRMRQVGSERWMTHLVREDFGLSRERQPLEVVPAANVVETLAPEEVGLQDTGQSGAQLLELPLTKLFRISR